MLTWEKLTRAWGQAINERDPGAILPMLADDFHWPTSARGPEGGMRYGDVSDWCLTAPLEEHTFGSTIHDGEEILVDTFTVSVEGEVNKGLGVAKLRDDKVYEFHHMRSLA